MECLKYAAYFSYTIIQISRCKNMLEICQVCALLKINSILIQTFNLKNALNIRVSLRGKHGWLEDNVFPHYLKPRNESTRVKKNLATRH